MRRDRNSMTFQLYANTQQKHNVCAIRNHLANCSGFMAFITTLDECVLNGIAPQRYTKMNGTRSDIG